MALVFHNRNLLIIDCSLHTDEEIHSRGFQEETLHLWPFVCLKNRQADPPRINGEYPKEWRFLLKRVRVISLSCFVEVSPKDTLWRLHPVIGRSSSKNGRILFLENKLIRQIKWPKVGLKSLLIRSCLKKRIRERAVWDYRNGNKP